MTLPSASSVTREFDKPAATITLDESARHRRRMRMVSDRMENGATIAFLTWMWLSAVIVISGAEFNSEIENAARKR